MSIRSVIAKMTPEPIKQVLRPIVYYREYHKYDSKYDAEFDFWRTRFKIDKGQFQNDRYSKLMLAMAQEDSDEFLRGKIVADFGCGPRGSLVWANAALMRIGIDVLADWYVEEFTDNLIYHDMIYLKSTEHVIPLPSDFADVVYTLNAIDHVDNFSHMCNEIIRVLKPGGDFIGSFNLEEPPSDCEPQQLNETIIKEVLLDKLDIQSYRITQKGPKEDAYAPFFDGNLSYEEGQEGCLWVRARKPG